MGFPTLFHYCSLLILIGDQSTHTILETILETLRAKPRFKSSLSICKLNDLFCCTILIFLLLDFIYLYRGSDWARRTAH